MGIIGITLPEMAIAIPGYNLYTTGMLFHPFIHQPVYTNEQASLWSSV